MTAAGDPVVDALFDAVELMNDAQKVIGYRMLGLAGVWGTPLSEPIRMIDEKAAVFAASGIAAGIALFEGRGPDAVLGAALRPYREAAADNARRLSGRGFRRPGSEWD